MPVIQARYVLANLMPAFAQRAYGRSFTTEGLFTLYDIDAGIMSDMLQVRFPSHTREEALPLIARDRRIQVGPHESPETIRARLRLWIDQRQLAGLPVGFLLSLQAYLAPQYPQVRLVTRRGIWYTLGEGAVGRILNLPGYALLPPCPYELGASWPVGAPPQSQIQRLFHTPGMWARHKAPTPNFDWDSISNPENADRWWHCWAIVYPPYYTLQQPYDSGWNLDDALDSWGFQEPSGTFTTLKAITKEFRSSRNRVVSIIFAPSLNDFLPTNLPAAPGMPDGWWGQEVKQVVAGQWETTRREDCRYLFPPDND